MANVKISGLPAATSVTAGTDVAPLVSGGITTKATPQQIVNAGLLAPGAIGSGTASTGAFTTLSASSTVSGTGFSTYLASPPAIGSTAPSTGKFTTVESTIATGTAPFTVASTTNVANLNASSLGGATFAAPGAIGSGTASTGAFTTLSASSTVSGTGFSTYLLSPPAIGTTAPAAGKFTDLTSTGNTTIGDASTDTFTVYPQTISLINSTAITAASTKTLTLNGGAGSNGLVIDANNNVSLSKAIHVPGGGGIATNEAFGTGALLSNTAGANNVAVGNSALTANTVDFNTAVGSGALAANTTGYSSTASGYQALYSSTTGNYNTASGFKALYTNTTGYNNTANGYQALYANTTGNSNVGIGYAVASSSITVSNEVNIYNGSVTARFQGAALAWSFVSDVRDKKDIEPLTLGLEFVSKLQPRKFKWDIRDCDVDKDKEASGLIAQEVLEVIQVCNAEYAGLVDTNDSNKYTLATGNLIPILVKAIQELSAELNELKAKVNVNV